MRAVLDTNVLVSALLSAGSPPDAITRGGYEGEFQLISSAPLVSELQNVLTRRRIQDRLGWSDPEVAGFITYFSEQAIMVQPQSQLAVITSDPADNRVLEAALEGKADYVVSGDRHLLDLRAYGGIRIVTPAVFAAVLAGR